MVTKIMPLGASNTYGMYQDTTSPGGYRGPLQYMLQSQGVSYDFVGIDRDGAIADADHNGHSGKPIDWYLGPVNEGFWDHTGSYSHWINSGGKPAIHYFIEQAGLQQTDVILLLVGTNDVRLGDSAETMLREMDQLLKLIVEHPASPQVQLMKLQPIGGDWWADNDPSRTNNDTIRIFNEGLEKLVNEKYAGLGVTLVDDKATTADLSVDGVHLNEAGYRDMATAWFESLMATATLDSNGALQLSGTTAKDSAAWTREFNGTKRNDNLTGNDVNNRLDGREGADTMSGKGGDDTYVVDNVRDVVVEEANGGIDTVLTTLSTYSLGNNVENLTFTGTGRSSLTGNALDNILKGGTGADVLNGGAGADQLFGGAGADTFVLRKGEAAGDRVADFEAGDQLRLEGYGRGAVLMENRATTSVVDDWVISYNGGVEVIQISGRITMTEGTDFLFV